MVMLYLISTEDQSQAILTFDADSAESAVEFVRGQNYIRRDIAPYKTACFSNIPVWHCFLHKDGVPYILHCPKPKESNADLPFGVYFIDSDFIGRYVPFDSPCKWHMVSYNGKQAQKYICYVPSVEHLRVYKIISHVLDLVYGDANIPLDTMHDQMLRLLSEPAHVTGHELSDIPHLLSNSLVAQ